MNAQNTLKRLKNEITHCIYCKSSILWDGYGNAEILKSANNHVFECMKTGCCLVIQKIPEYCSTPEELGSFLMTLIQDGIPSEVAESAALRLISERLAA